MHMIEPYYLRALLWKLCKGAIAFYASGIRLGRECVWRGFLRTLQAQPHWR